MQKRKNNLRVLDINCFEYNMNCIKLGKTKERDFENKIVPSPLLCRGG